MDPSKLPERFRSKIRVNVETGCWEWQSTISNGYGQYWLRGVNVYAHRFAYGQLVGEIAPGFCIDHLCRNRRCVNPEHMEPVTMRLNIHRGIAPTAVNARKTHCIRGHEFTAENTRWQNGGRKRVCRACMRQHSRAFCARNRERLRLAQRAYRRRQKAATTT